MKRIFPLPVNKQRKCNIYFFSCLHLFGCVDDSGRWGRGGLFTALELRSDEVKKQYELAGDMEGDYIHPCILADPSATGRPSVSQINASVAAFQIWNLETCCCFLSTTSSRD